MAVMRYVLRDGQWTRMSPLCLGKVGDRGRSGSNNRLFLEAVLWITRTGSPWRDLPPEFGKWSTVLKRFRDWVKADVFQKLFDAVSDQPHMEYVMLDATMVRVHRHGKGAKEGLRAKAIGRSRGGLTTKILALTDTLGNLIRFVLRPGQRHDLQGVEQLLEGIDLLALLADKAFDADWLEQRLLAQGFQVVIAHKSNRRAPLQIDIEVYKWRHLIENFFCKLKEFKRIAMRCDKTDSSFAAVITLVSAVINSR
ncbi:IS5 family transposase [Comamonas testosteroni]|uniref:IS5 family transposase n=1 Tax=Comamonas testosteroni TaxID=285 RepID=UPI001184D7B0|nr:IS5 family transposase [Comamonas testosteroni]